MCHAYFPADRLAGRRVCCRAFLLAAAGPGWLVGDGRGGGEQGANGKKADRE